MAFLNAASSAAMIKDGKLRPIAVLAAQRLAEYPDVPTLAEAGYPGIGTLHWQSMLAPAATPNEIIATLHKASAAALQARGCRKSSRSSSISATPNTSVDDTQAWLKEEIASWRRIVSEVKIELTD